MNYCDRPKVMGGIGKRQLADGLSLHVYTIGKLRRLRLPLPPGIHPMR